jgi:hypothetical protein
VDITSVIQALSHKRKIFVSEADFQFSLAWQIQQQYPKADIRLEYCPVEIDPSMHVDILVKMDDSHIPIEVKYFKMGCDVIVEGERFILKNQGAQDIARYDFLKDITRIEKLIQADSKFSQGYVVLLTNDPTYRNAPVSAKTCDAQFRIHKDALKSGELSWDERTGKGTMLGREKPLSIRGNYLMDWQDYSKIDESRAGSFRLLCLQIKNEPECREDFWVYENWVAEKKAILHKSECSHCNNGMGTQKKVHGDKNGKWHGNFKSYKEAKAFAQGLKDREVRDCGHCKPGIATIEGC